MNVMMIQGKVENIFDNEDFARMLQEKLGSDAEQYFREQTDPETVLEGENISTFCCGECSHTDKLIENHVAELKEINRKLNEIIKQSPDLSKDSIEEKLNDLSWEIERTL